MIFQFVRDKRATDYSRPLGMNTRGILKNKQNLYGQLMIDE